MSPLVTTYLVWALLGTGLAIALFLWMRTRDEVPPKLQPFAAIGLAVALIVIGPRGSHRWSTGRSSRESSFSRSVANAKQQTARLDALRTQQAAALEKAKTKADAPMAEELVRAADALASAGYASEALPAYDRAHAILVALGAGNGDWAVDRIVYGYLSRYIQTLKDAGRSREAGALVVLDQKIRGIHASRIR